MYLEGSQEFGDYPSELTERYFVSNHLIGEGAMGKVLDYLVFSFVFVIPRN